MAYGFLGVLGFSFMLPATPLAVASFDPVIVGLGRALIAACFAAPILLVPVGLAIRTHGLEASASSWFGLAYVSVISMFLAFFAWYHGLANGGVARVSQLQLLQPFLTLAFSALFLGERFGLGATACAGLVALSIFVSRRSRVRFGRSGTPHPPVLRTESPTPRTGSS